MDEYQKAVIDEIVSKHLAEIFKEVLLSSGDVKFLLESISSERAKKFSHIAQEAAKKKASDIDRAKDITGEL